MAPRRTLTDSPFDTLEKTFDLLVIGPNPLALDGTGIDGLPDRAIPLGELKARLLHPSTPFDVRDAVVGGARHPLAARRGTMDGRAGRGAPARLAPRCLAPRPGLSRQGGRHRGRDPGRLLGRRRRVHAGSGSAGFAAVLAGPHRRQPVTAGRTGRARPAWQRTGVRGAAPTVGAPRPRPRQSSAGRGAQRRGRRADRRHPHRRCRPGRRRQRTGDRLQGVPPTASPSRIGPRGMAHL